MARTLIITAGGFSQYRDATHEIQAIDIGGWFPQTVDFDATAAFTRGARILGATDEKTFFGALSAVKSESRILFIGHGNSSQLGLAGSAGTFSKFIGIGELKKWHTTIQGAVTPKVKGKTFDLIACNLGVDKKLAQKLADELQLTVRAFPGAVTWHVGLSEDRKTVTSRGLICGDKKCKKKIKGAHRLKPSKVFKPKAAP